MAGLNVLTSFFNLLQGFQKTDQLKISQLTQRKEGYQLLIMLHLHLWQFLLLLLRQ